MTAGPLSGIRVIDLCSMISGPIATRILADQGADVIKVEAPGGDQVRRMGASRNGVTATFATSNRNKRSVVLDLKNPDGLRVLERLVAGADIFVQNFRPGAVERLGIGEPALRKIRPDLIYVSISGFGESGPYAHKRVYDPVIQALSGLATIQADRDTGRPHMVRTILPDKLTGITAAQAITAAIVARERTGTGQHVRLAMLDAMVAFLWPEAMTEYTFIGGEVVGARHGMAQDLVFETTDGYITVGTVTDAEWAGLSRAAERPEWREDPRFDTAAGRVVNAVERLAMVVEVIKTRSSADWLERLDREEVPCAPILGKEELLVHPQIEANRLIVESDHPVGGRMRQPRPPERFDKTPSSIRAPAPALGQHTAEVLRELGLDDSEIAALRETKAVA